MTENPDARVPFALRLAPWAVARLKARVPADGKSPSAVAAALLEDLLQPPALAEHRWTADVQRGQVCATCGQDKGSAAPACPGSRTRATK